MWLGHLGSTGTGSQAWTHSPVYTRALTRGRPRQTHGSSRRAGPWIQTRDRGRTADLHGPESPRLPTGRQRLTGLRNDKTRSLWPLSCRQNRTCFPRHGKPRRTRLCALPLATRSLWAFAVYLGSLDLRPPNAMMAGRDPSRWEVACRPRARPSRVRPGSAPNGGGRGGVPGIQTPPT